jgi:hypothetical protein
MPTGYTEKLMEKGQTFQQFALLCARNFGALVMMRDDAAKELFAAQQASEFQNQLKIALLTAEAKMRMASNWDGKMPLNILPSDSPMLMSLGNAKQTTQ